MSILDHLVEQERLRAGCRALGLTAEQIPIEMAKHHVTLLGLYESLARGWAPDSPVHPLDYEPPKFAPGRLAEIARQLSEIGNGLAVRPAVPIPRTQPPLKKAPGRVRVRVIMGEDVKRRMEALFEQHKGQIHDAVQAAIKRAVEEVQRQL